MSATDTIFIRGACPHDCPDTCAVITEVHHGKAIGFTGDAEHQFTDGWLCAKVRPYLDRVYHPDRVLYPQRRVGPKGSGDWERISWNSAIDEITNRWKSIAEEYGAEAILPYSYSGTLGLVQMGVSSARLWGRMGASGLQRSICGAAAETAVEATLGARQAPDPTHLLDSKMIIIWGHNPASTSPHVVPYIRKAQRNGAEVVVIDPRRTITARSADLHLQPKPATDGALALGILNVIFSENLHDKEWLEQHSIGWEDLRDRAREFPPERVAKITGLEREVIIALSRRYATTSPAVIKIADGIQRHGNGGQTSRLMCCLPAVTGQIGLRGGGLYYSTSGYVNWNDEALSHISGWLPVLRTVNMNRIGAALTGEFDNPPIMSLYVFAANPVTSSPNSSLTIKGLQRDDLFTVVHELFMTDTAQYADIVLPATTQLEQVDLHKPYGHRNLQYNAQAIAPVGESKSNWDVMRLLAESMGFEDDWLSQDADEVIEEVLAATRPSNSLLKDVTLDRLQSEGTVPYSFEDQAEVPFADLQFPTASGKVELRCEEMAEYGLDPVPDYQPPSEFGYRDMDDSLVLISGASHHYVSSSLANLPVLNSKEGSPFVEINPKDAECRKVVHGQSVIVENSRGWCSLRAVVTDNVPTGVVVAPKGNWAINSPDGRNINWTTSDALADLAGQSTFHSNLVTIRPAS